MKKRLRATIAANGPQLLQFLRFCAVGATGFVVDAGVLLIELHAFSVNPIWGRFISFSVAVLTTFELNRNWAFKRANHKSYLSALGSYLGIQGVGFACSFIIYTALYILLPLGYNAPLFCLAVGSVIALAVNYAGASLIVFRPKASQDNRLGGP